MKSTAIVSDVHGNVRALEAVLEDMHRAGVKEMINLGDSLYGPLYPAESARLMMSLPMISVRGNEDRVLLENDDTAHGNPTVDFVKRTLLPEHRFWLESHSPVAGDESYIAFHGLLEDDMMYCLMKVTADGVAARTPQELSDLLAGRRRPLVLCGHDHTPGLVTLTDSTRVLNPGSVGLQAYDDDAPLFHVIETGSPHARYAIVWDSGDEQGIEFRQVEYNWQAAAKRARQNHRDDWAVWLEYGRVL